MILLLPSREDELIRKIKSNPSSIRRNLFWSYFFLFLTIVAITVELIRGTFVFFDRSSIKYCYLHLVPLATSFFITMRKQFCTC